MVSAAMERQTIAYMLIAALVIALAALISYKRRNSRANLERRRHVRDQAAHRKAMADKSATRDDGGSAEL
jgi:LPXTG-motif cell wall-anchored protein